jgi:hypothetical protein
LAGGQGVLPLGWNSAFLKAAVSIGAAPSEAFGLWTGSRSIDHPVDGSVVIGGYDSTRFDPNKLTTFPAHDTCTTCVVITGLSYDTINGSTSLFSNASESLQVSLEPYQRVLQVPQDIFMNFANASNGIYDTSLRNLRYSADTPPTGNLTVTLSTGYQTVIPTEELFVDPRLYNDLGQYSVSNNTVLIAEMRNATIGNTLLSWGIPYLTMNYLIADYARNKFQMAPAIRTDFVSQGGGYQLEAICDPTVPTSTTTSSTSTGTATTTGPGITTSSAPPTASKSNNTGAIVGGVVGGVLGLILIVGGLGLLLYLSRRRRRSIPPTAESTAPARDEMSQPGDAPTERFSHFTSYTGTTPNEANEAKELSSEGNAAQNVKQWLSSEGSEVRACSVVLLLRHAQLGLFTGSNVTERRPTIRNAYAAVRHLNTQLKEEAL